MAVRYSFETHDESRMIGVVKYALWGFPSIIIFVGLVLIQYSKDWEPDAGVQPDHGPVIEAPYSGPPVAGCGFSPPDGGWKGAGKALYEVSPHAGYGVSPQYAPYGGAPRQGDYGVHPHGGAW